MRSCARGSVCVRPIAAVRSLVRWVVSRLQQCCTSLWYMVELPPDMYTGADGHEKH